MTTTKTDFIAQLQGLIAGIGKHYAGQTVLVNGATVTCASVVTLFQTAIDAENAAKLADTTRTAAVAKATAAMQQARPTAKGFTAMVLAASGSDTATLADFELKPRKVTVPSPEVKAAAAQKAAATRKALGTKGAQQKKAAKKALAAQPAAATAPAVPAVTAPKA